MDPAIGGMGHPADGGDPDTMMPNLDESFQVSDDDGDISPTK